MCLKNNEVCTSVSSRIFTTSCDPALYFQTCRPAQQPRREPEASHSPAQPDPTVLPRGAGVFEGADRISQYAFSSAPRLCRKPALASRLPLGSLVGPASVWRAAGHSGLLTCAWRPPAAARGPCSRAPLLSEGFPGCLSFCFLI